jgi:hypothetical protein
MAEDLTVSERLSDLEQGAGCCSNELSELVIRISILENNADRLTGAVWRLEGEVARLNQWLPWLTQLWRWLQGAPRD